MDEQSQGIALFEAYEESCQEHFKAMFVRSFQNAPLEELVAAERKWRKAGIAMREYLSAVPVMQNALLGIKRVLTEQSDLGWSGIDPAAVSDIVEERVNKALKSVAHIEDGLDQTWYFAIDK